MNNGVEGKTTLTLYGEPRGSVHGSSFYALF